MSDARTPRASVDTTTRLLSMQSRTVRRWLQEGSSGRDPAAADVRTVDGTVLSADISGFTRLAERLAADGVRQAAESLITAINRCFEPMIAEVHRRGGDVLKFGGDAIFVLFEGPAHAAQAAKAASHLQQSIGLVDLGIDLTLSMTVGVASGPVSLILAGTERRELLVQGPVVDECLRLEGDAEPGEVLISTGTASLIAADWVTEPEPGVLALADLNRVPFDAPPADSSAETEPTEINWWAVTGDALASAVEAFDRTVGEIRVVTVAFVMLPTTELTDEEIAATVERAMTLSTRYGATVLGTDVAVGGIKILLAAGAPSAGEGDEDAMLATLVDLVLHPDAPPMKAGVNRGLVFAGFLGASQCRTFTVMGDPTNLAARLLGKANSGAVAVSQSVLDHARARYPTVELPPVMVKGRVQPVTVHQLEGPPAAARRGRTAPPLVGRSAELEILGDAWNAARSGSGVVLDIRSAPGVGASRLISHFVDGLSGGVPRFRVQGLVHTVGSPYQAVSGFLRSVAGIADDASRAEAGVLLSDWVSRLSPDTVALIPLLAPAFRATVSVTDPAVQRRLDDIEPEFRQPVANSAIVRLIAESLTVPTVVVVEDRRWLDDASRDLLSALAAEMSDHPWLVLSSSRPDGDRWDATPDVARSLTLEPLDTAATVALISSVYDLPAHLLSAVAETSGGNPLFAIELAASVDRAGGKAEGAGHLMPDSIERLITSQIDQLGHNNRALVRTAAVLGPSFPVEMLSDLLERDVGNELKAVGQLIDVTDGVGSFRSEVVAEVAYGGLSGHRRAELHGRVAAVLEEHRADLSQLAWHHAKAGHHGPAWQYSCRAADRAAELGLVGAAADHLQQAVEAADAGGEDTASAAELTEVLASAFQHCVAAKRYEAASRHGERALGRLTDRLERAKLLIRLVTINAEVDGSYQRQIDRLNEELASYGSDAADAEARAWLQATLAGMYYRLDDLDRALVAVDNAVADAASGGQRGPLVPAFRIRQVVLAGQADPERIEVGSVLIQLATELEDHRALHSAHNNLGLDLMEDGRWDEAVEHFDLAIEQADRIGDEHGTLLPAINRAAIAVNRGLWDQARDALHELRRDAMHYGSGFVAAFVQAEIGRLEVNAGRAADGRDPLAAALQWFQDAKVTSNEYEVLLTLAAADIADGRGADGLVLLADLEPPQDLVAQQIGRRELLAGYANMQLGNAEEALGLLEEALAAAEGTNRFGAAEALIGAAEAEGFLGRNRSARRRRAEGEQILADLGVERLPVIPLPK